MKIKIFILSCLFLPLFGYNQTNLILNSGFENVLNGGDYCGGTPQDYDYYPDLINYWSNEAPWTVPYFSDYCSIDHYHSVGSPEVRCPGGHNSEHYAKCEYQEYVLQHLSTPMQIGHLYYLEFYVKNGSNALSDAGLKLYVDRPKQCDEHPINPDGSPDSPIPYGTDLTDWTKISKTIIAFQSYEWVALGNFLTSGSSTGRTYNFDDITIMEVGSSACPDVNYIQNLYFQDIGLITYPSQNLTISGYNIASTLTPGNVIIGSNALVEYKSATMVVLENGFSTDDGAFFEAKIAPCNADCFPPSPNAGANQEACNGQTLQLGSASQFGCTYSWSANPSSALAYLSSSNTSNPIFTPPTTGNGTITYTLTVTNECGQSSTDQVVVSYENNPNNNPTVSVTNINYSDLISFDVNYGAQTDEIIIEVWTVGGSLVNTYTYHSMTDFSCCTFHWQISNNLSPCTDYVVKVRTKNICSTVLSTPYIINWNRNRTVSIISTSNVMDLNSSVNNAFCFNFSGGVSYQIEIHNGSGVLLFTGSGSILPPNACVWHGECNGPLCSGSLVEDNTVFYTLTITGCNGTTDDHAGFITVFTVHSPIAMSPPQNGIANNENKFVDVFKSEIYPNPNDGTFQIIVTKNDKPLGVQEIKVFDMMGKVVWSSGESANSVFKIDISDNSNGIYYLKVVNSEGEIEMKKLLKQ